MMARANGEFAQDGLYTATGGSLYPAVRYPRMVGIILLSGGPALAIMFAALAPLLPTLATRIDHVPSGVERVLVAQLAMTMPGIGIILGGPAAGWALERVTPRTLMTLAMIGSALFGSIGLVSIAAPVLIIFRWLLGFAAGGIAATTIFFLNAHYDTAQRNRLLGYNSALSALFGTGSLLASGWLIEHVSWKAPFGIFLIGVPLAVLTRVVLPNVASVHVRSGGRNLQQLLGMWRLYFGSMLLFAALFMGSVQLSLMLGQMSYNAAVVSYVLSGNAIGTLIGALVYGRAAEIYGAPLVLRLAMIVMSVGILAIGLVPVLWGAAVGAAILGLGAGLMVPGTYATVIDKAPPALTARAVGLLLTAIYLGEFINPLLVAPLRYWVGFHGAFITVGAALAAIAAVMIYQRRLGMGTLG